MFPGMKIYEVQEAQSLPDWNTIQHYERELLKDEWF